MPRHSYTYPERMIKTDEGKALYAIWRRVRHNACDAFQAYPDFFEWAVGSGYVLGARLRRLDETIEYRPDNCSFLPSFEGRKPLTLDERVRANEWNKTVNKIRRVYGMKPFETFTDEEVRQVG